jgi:hypothetical protein
MSDNNNNNKIYLTYNMLELFLKLDNVGKNKISEK